MKCKILLAATLILANCTLLRAHDSISVRKNEIGINFRPILKAISNRNTFPISLSYKRAIRNFYLRAHFSFSHSTLSNTSVYSWDDSSYTELNGNSENYSFTERIGFEKRKDLGKLYLLYGVDIVAEQSVSKITEEKFKYIADSISNSPDPTYYPERHFDSATLVSESSYKSYVIGFGIPVGLIIPIGNRWLLTLENRVDIFRVITKEHIENTEENSNLNYSSSGTNLKLLNPALLLSFKI